MLDGVPDVVVFVGDVVLVDDVGEFIGDFVLVVAVFTEFGFTDDSTALLVVPATVLPGVTGFALGSTILYTLTTEVVS